MTKNISLANMNAGRSYQVLGFENKASEYAVKLCKMGFVEGTTIELAPVNLTDPMVIQIRGSRVALRKKEAQQVLVKEV